MQTVQEKIRQRRRQMLVHSYIYYELNQNIISDAQWSKWAMELVQLQRDYPKESAEVEFADLFSDWDGSSGAFLKFGDDIISVAKHLLNYRNQSTENLNTKSAQKVQKSSKKSLNPKKSVKSSGTRSLF